MGKIQFEIDIENKKIILDWSALTDDQLYWIGRSQGYKLEIPNPDQESVDQGGPTTITNPLSLIPWILMERLQKISSDATIQYLSETPDPRIEQARQMTDFKPE